MKDEQVLLRFVLKILKMEVSLCQSFKHQES